ncbi:Lar family restriction alleviation protein [Burkholderia anthina]|uniref:Lar family restriction alleviation protein n=1 Tax=Burkholderia anthina TaxID=179879 RepID=A0A6P2GEX2_9BURK|nr:Lar family restriction alleviation protein [Burkholderia anthina]MBM2769882.1 Lar family restriction alleviation protein [Burkholderia anthina]VVU51856.1 hypothetical protein BAN20980_04579 [Burkholderia anthina]
MTTTNHSRTNALTDLLPCPHCGHAAQIMTGDGPFFGRVQVECGSCRIATFWYDQAVAVRQWNRRVSASPVEQHEAAPADERSVLNLAIEALQAFAGSDDFHFWHKKYHPAIEKARRVLAASKEIINVE